MTMKTWLEAMDDECLADEEMRRHMTSGKIEAPKDGYGLNADTPPKANKYLREVKPGVMIDVYDVLQAWRVDNPALQHLIKKALQAGQRGHKSRDEDLEDIVASAVRARELG